MKKMLTITLIFLLYGCNTVNSFWVAKYDTNEYNHINQLRTIAQLSLESCSNVQVSKQNFSTLYNSSLEFKNFTQYLQRNSKAHDLAINLHELVNQGLEMYITNNIVSTSFCELSLLQIIGSAESIQQVLGGKPK